jgi:hypothetical protein
MTKLPIEKKDVCQVVATERVSCQLGKRKAQ